MSHSLTAVPSTASALEPAERDRIEDIATNQRRVLYVVLAYFVAAAGSIAALEPDVHPTVAAVAYTVLVVAQVGIGLVGLVFAVRLAQALYGSKHRLLYVVLVVLLNGIMLLMMIGFATGELRRAGLPVTLFGVSSEDVAAWRLRG